jgi:hypothetical protein
MEILTTLAKSQPVVFKLINGETVMLYEPFSHGKDHVSGVRDSGTKHHQTIRYDAIASVYIEPNY